jgi:hypothetical protein
MDSEQPRAEAIRAHCTVTEGRPAFSRIKLISAIWAEPACEAVWYDDTYADNSGFEVPQDPCPLP